jgi:hypothetical protein
VGYSEEEQISERIMREEQNAGGMIRRGAPDR